MNRLLLRQLKRTASIESPAALDSLLTQLRLLADSGTLSPDVERLVAGFDELFNRISAAYDHTDRHLELFARSLELSSEELESAQAELLQLSRTDALTKLWNRGYWSERLQEEFQRAKRLGSAAAMVIFDIDHFKKINDNFGHPAGDDVIRRTAALLRATARSVDICGRYGGEEFSVILPGTEEEGALRFAEKLRRNIAEGSCRYGDTEIAYTISLGIAALTPDIDAVDQWLVRADEGLYAAKRSGRNRVCTWTPDLAGVVS